MQRLVYADSHSSNMLPDVILHILPLLLDWDSLTLQGGIHQDCLSTMTNDNNSAHYAMMVNSALSPPGEGGVAQMSLWLMQC